MEDVIWGRMGLKTWTEVKVAKARCKKWRKFGLYLEVEQCNRSGNIALFNITLWGPDNRKVKRDERRQLGFEAARNALDIAHLQYARYKPINFDNIDVAIRELKILCKLV